MYFTRKLLELFCESNDFSYTNSAVTFKELFVAQHFQRDIVRGLDGFISTSKKQMELGMFFGCASLAIPR